MLLTKINDIVLASQKVADSLGRGGLRRPSQRIDKTIRMLKLLTTGTEEDAKQKLASKPFKAELDFLSSAVTDIKGLKDVCPKQLEYEDWRAELSSLNDALNKLK
ncbi:hypothetical protein A3759_16025 [Thalassolituus sp. HI0120]|nr:hypothetical protein A3759_16025 [Thalassolituus sp. HI0120]